MNHVRLLPLATGSGPVNMAHDDVLLLAAERGVASLRFYTWNEPTLSLGYFQLASERETHPRLAALPWVRRATGGAAIVHDPSTEFTYAFAVPGGERWQKLGVSLICEFHYIIRDVLKSLGVAARSVVCGEEVKHGPMLCFLHQTAGDLVCGRSKIAGSAQRKSRGALLQHGSVLLNRSSFAPELPGIAEQTGIAVSAIQIIPRMLERIPEKLGWYLHASDWQAGELGDSFLNAEAKYASDEWNTKR